MTYLDLARSALSACEKSEKSPSQTTSGPCEETADCEKSEKCEKRSGLEPGQQPLTPDAAERLKARIIAAVTVDPAVFDRAEYEALTARWNAYEASLSRFPEQRDPHVPNMPVCDPGKTEGNLTTTWNHRSDRRVG